MNVDTKSKPVTNRIFVIIPGCSDLNRGDQALVWETKRLAEEAGFVGDYSLTSEQKEPVHQSKDFGLNIIRPILEHPSRIFDDTNNIDYNFALKIRWGLVASFDFIISLLFLYKLTRPFVKVLASKEKKNSLRTMQNASAFFVKGGGLIHSYGGITSTYSMYFSVYHILLASSLNKPIFIMPNSFGPFEGPFVKKIVKHALKKCNLVATRESFSQDMLMRDLQIQAENYPDLAFYLENTDTDKSEFLAMYNLPSDKKLVAITMRPHRFPGSTTPKEDYLKFKSEMAYFIKWLNKQGFMPVLIEHTLAVNSHENDGSCINDVIELLEQDEFRFVTNKEYTCHGLKMIYSHCDYILGTRFHSVIFSLSNNVPGIAITYAGNKGQGIMNDIGLKDLTVSIKEVSCEILINKFTYLLSNETEIKRSIKSYNNLALMQRKDLIKRISNEKFLS